MASRNSVRLKRIYDEPMYAVASSGLARQAGQDPQLACPVARPIRPPRPRWMPERS